MLKDHIYLDHNATSMIHPDVSKAMEQSYDLPLNASSVHSFGQYGKKLISQARSSLAEFIDCLSDEIIFTSGGTESNNSILSNPWDAIFISATEHDSVFRANPNAKTIPVQENGIVDFAWMEKALQNLPKYYSTLVSVQYANNETGIIQPLKELTELVHRYGAIMHSDSVQVFGKLPISFKNLDVDFMSLGAHKVGGPQGIGALIAKKNTFLRSFLKGGGQEKNRRAGTENISGIVGFGTLPSVIDFGFYDQLEKWHREIESELKDFSLQHNHSCFVVGEESKRLPNTTCIAMPGTNNGTQLMHFDLEKIAVSTGSACSSGSIKPSYILHGMKLPESVYTSAIRASSGWTTHQEDLKKFANAWKKIFLQTIINKEER